MNGKKVLEGLEAFTLAGLKPRWVILDDGWQSTTNEKALNGEQVCTNSNSIVRSGVCEEQEFPSYSLIIFIDLSFLEFGI